MQAREQPARTGLYLVLPDGGHVAILRVRCSKCGLTAQEELRLLHDAKDSAYYCPRGGLHKFTVPAIAPPPE